MIANVCFGSIADMCSAQRHVRFVPIADSAPQQIATSFKHLIGASDKRIGDIETEPFGGLEINEQLDFGGLLDRQVGGLVTLKYPAGEAPAKRCVR